MKPKSKKRLHSVLGLSLADGQLRAFHVVLAKGGCEVEKSASAALSLDLLHPEAELVGREIRNHLDAAGIRERRCIVAVPPRWVMSQHAKVPELSPADTASFLQLEAEKGFPVDPAQLQIAQSFQRSSAGLWVTQLGVRKEQLEKLGAVLKAAGLKPVSFSPGLAVLPGAVAPAGSGRITVAVEPAGVALLVSTGGGIAAFRTFEASIQTEEGEKIVNGPAVARELRITFEQMPVELRAEVRQLVLTGDSPMVRQLVENLGEWANTAGLEIKRADLPEKNLAAELAEQLAIHWLEAGFVELEFLPPRLSAWAQFMSRYSSKRLATAGFAAAAVAVLALLAFGWLEIRRWSLLSEWHGMQAQVVTLDATQGRIRQYRPWYDTSFRTLSIFKRVTECFPENGTVTAKTFEIHGNTIVSIGGTTRDKAALLRVLDQLRTAKEIQGLKIEQIRSPATGLAQFTFTFRWNALSGS
jgi:hypothetical protein